MTKKPNAAFDRRSAIRVGAAGAVATAATVATATNAEAAAGQAVLQGRVNTVGTAGTTLTSSGTAISLTVKNTGPGAAAYFFGQNNNGFAGGTAGPNAVGLSAANTGPAGGGAAVAAVGVNNTGILTNTRNEERFVVEATNLGDTYGGGGAILADGGDAGVGLLAFSRYFDVPAVESVGDVWLHDGGVERSFTTNFVELIGVSSANGPEVTISGKVLLDGSGGATAQIPTDLVTDLDLSSPVSLVSANSGPMPGLWITTDATGLVSITGGTASGSVSYRVVAMRADVADIDVSAARSTQRSAVAGAGGADGQRPARRSRKG